MYEINQHKNVLYKEDFVRIFENQHIIQEKWKNKSPILTRAHTVMGRDELLQDITFLYHAREDVKIKTNGQAIVRGLKEKKPLTDLFDTESFILYGQEMLVKEMLTRIQGFKVWHIIFDTLFNIPMPIYQVVEEPIDENQLKYAVKKPETWYRKLPQTIWQWLLNKLKVSRQ